MYRYVWLRELFWGWHKAMCKRPKNYIWSLAKCQGYSLSTFLLKKQLSVTGWDASCSFCLNRSLGAWQIFMREEQWNLKRNYYARKPRCSKNKKLEFPISIVSVEWFSAPGQHSQHIHLCLNATCLIYSPSFHF